MKQKINNLISKAKTINWFIVAKIVSLPVIAFLINFYLQLCQNDFVWRLARKFAFSWHVEKFWISTLVLLILLLFIVSVAGSFLVGSTIFIIAFILLGYADYLKMSLRTEPIYPDDLKMVTQWSLMSEMVGNFLFFVALLATIGVFIVLGYSIYKSFFFSKKKQILRVMTVIITSISLVYISQFNHENNLVRKAYNRTALWIPYSQKMNYYNTGFVAGFLYNLNVEVMDEPDGYSKDRINTITQKYNNIANRENEKLQDEVKPNIVYIMAESFSDPLRLNQLSILGDPLQEYRAVTNQTISGQMLSQGYGGGTANIEFEALTSFSLESFSPQLTTPYTMLLPKLKQVPSVVSFLGDQDYTTTAIHPYNTSMYKRKDVYKKMGFDSFISETDMQHKDTIDNNSYISDAAAFQEVLDILESSDQPQFIQLVTMQGHMPYNNRYKQLDYQVEIGEKKVTIENYLQDISYTSKALESFLNELTAMEEETLVVFWGDHLPSIYPEEILQKNTEAALHETEYFFFNSKMSQMTELEGVEGTISPIYFTPLLLKANSLKLSGFYAFLLELQQILPAFEKGIYLIDNRWESTLSLSPHQQLLYEEYRLIEYDIFAGNQYSIQTNFFEGSVS